MAILLSTPASCGGVVLVSLLSPPPEDILLTFLEMRRYRVIRLIIDVPATTPHALFETNDQIHNLLVYAMGAQGYHPPAKQTAAWGFGVISQPVSVNGPRRLRRIQQIIVGSSHPDAANALARLTPGDLMEPSQVPGAGLDLRTATIRPDDPWIPTDVLAARPVSPIRVLEHRDGANGSTALLTLGEAWESALNRTMTRRLGRPVQLRVIPDDLYVRERQGHIVGRRAVKRDRLGRPVVLPGLEFPFILIGTPEDLRDAWVNGLGAGTGMGFGCLVI